MSAHRLKLALSCLPLLACLTTSSAFAHAHLESQLPAADSEVTSPKELRLNFSEGVEEKFTKVAISLDGPGDSTEVIQTQSVTTDPADKKVLIVVPAVPLADGAAAEVTLPDVPSDVPEVSPVVGAVCGAVASACCVSPEAGASVAGVVVSVAAAVSAVVCVWLSAVASAPAAGASAVRVPVAASDAVSVRAGAEVSLAAASLAATVSEGAGAADVVVPA